MCLICNKEFIYFKIPLSIVSFQCLTTLLLLDGVFTKDLRFWPKEVKPRHYMYVVSPACKSAIEDGLWIQLIRSEICFSEITRK